MLYNIILYYKIKNFPIAIYIAVFLILSGYII